MADNVTLSAILSSHLKQPISMKIFLLVLLAIGLPVQAEVYKCTIKPNKTIYQATPCASDMAEQKIDTKPRSAEQEAVAAEASKKWQSKYSAQQATEKAAEKAAIKAEKEKQPRNIIVQVIQRPPPQLHMRKPSRRSKMSLR